MDEISPRRLILSGNRVPLALDGEEVRIFGVPVRPVVPIVSISGEEEKRMRRDDLATRDPRR